MKRFQEPRSALVLGVAFAIGLLGCESSDDAPPARSHHTNAASSAVSVGAGGEGGGAAGVGGTGGSGGGEDACAQLGDTFQQALDGARESAKSPGAVMGVLTPDCGLWTGASGTSTKTIAMSATDVLRIGSVTKTFVATTILELVSEKTVGLDDALETWAPGFPGGDAITLRQLLNHTSGIYNYTDDPTLWDEELADPKKVWTHQELVDIAAAHDPYFAPGAGWHYSNTDYILLGMVVEAATGSKIGPELRGRLLAPQMLTSTSFDGEEPVVGDLAHGFTKTGFDVTTYFDPSWAWAAGAIVSSVGDLAHWATALYGGSILDSATMAEMEQTVDTDVPGIHYGLGVFELDPSVALTTAWGHMGDIPGYHTHMFYLPEKKSAIVTIVNSDAASPNDITLAGVEILVQR